MKRERKCVIQGHKLLQCFFFIFSFVVKLQYKKLVVYLHILVTSVVAFVNLVLIYNDGSEL